MKRTTIKCPKCGRDISRSNYTKHIASCRDKLKEPYRLDHDDLNCKFCGKECKNKNSLIQHEIRCKNNPSRINVCVPNFNNAGRPAWNRGLTKETSDGVMKHSESITAYYTTHDGSFLGHKHSEETKLRISGTMKEYLKEHPDRVPYLLNHSSKVSYPEQYFMEVFDKEGVELSFHLQVGLYQLDFYNEERMLDVEIDGEQHYVDANVVKSDIRRTAYLTGLGWKIYRIRWADFKKKSLDEKHAIIEELKKLLQ